MPRHKRRQSRTPGAQRWKQKRATARIKRVLESQISAELKAKRVLREEKKKEAAKAWHKPVKQTKRAALKVRKKAMGMITERATSPRHLQFLIEPDRPFGDDRGKESHGMLSTAIVSYEYYFDRRMLILTWWKDWKKKIVGAAYAYFDVPNWVYERLVRASSKGRYIYYNIRTSYTYKRLSK